MIETDKDKNKNKKKEKKILEKLQKLLQMHHLLRAKKVIDEDWDEEDLDELLSRAELMEEALKNYMYQFGLSIYQNKQGKYYFKQFTETEGLRPRAELDDYHFSPREQEPNFIERLLEQLPEEKIMLNTTIESAVIDLYERDALMAEAFDELLNQEMEKCRLFLNETPDKAIETREQELTVPTQENDNNRLSENVEKDVETQAEPNEKAVLEDEIAPVTEDKSDEKFAAEETDILADIDKVDTISLEEALEDISEGPVNVEENVVYTDAVEQELQSSYQCGEKTVGRQNRPRPRNVRRLPETEPLRIKDSQNER